MRCLTLVLAFALLLPLAACERQPPGPAVRIPLATRLSDASVTGSQPAEGPAPVAVRDGMLVQRGGSTVTFALPLPVGAILRGRGVAGDVARPSAESWVRVVLRSQDGTPTTLAEQALASDTRVALDADLSRHAGELVALDFTLSGSASAAANTMRWSDLAIEGFEATRKAAPQALPSGRYNVLVILLDSLRADHIAPYGAPEAATPNLARLAQQGVTFSNARSTSSWTTPAVASLFTSRSPWAHDLMELGQMLPEVLPYLPEMLADAGWDTVGISATPMFSRRYGFLRGFPKITPLWRNPAVAELEGPEARADWVWHNLIAPAAKSEAPFFAYLHELDPHSPFDPSDAYVPDAAREYTGRRVSSDPDWLARIRAQRSEFTEAEIAWLNELYRGEIQAMDAYVGRLLEHLDAGGHAGDTLVIFLSDHGEEFDDHRSVGHGHTVHEELVRIPLLMRLAGVLPAGVRLDEAVDVLDVAPTVLDLIGLETPQAMQGRSLLPLLAGGSLPPRASLSSSNVPFRHALVWGRWKLLRDPDEDFRLYDLEVDPGEHTDLWRQQPVVGEALRQMLARRLREETPRAKIGRQVTEDLAPDVREQLSELGYIE